MEKLSDFKLVSDVSEITANSFVVILSAAYWFANYPSQKNIIEYKGTTYVLTIIKGTWHKILANSKTFANETKGVLSRCRGNEIICPNISDGIADIFSFKTAQDMIIDCAVFNREKRIEQFDIDEVALAICIEQKAIMSTPDQN